ncbi:hypothetical protein JCM16814_04300 [Desulfobaculum senezii]
MPASSAAALLRHAAAVFPDRRGAPTAPAHSGYAAPAPPMCHAAIRRKRPYVPAWRDVLQLDNSPAPCFHTRHGE